MDPYILFFPPDVEKTEKWLWSILESNIAVSVIYVALLPLYFVILSIDLIQLAHCVYLRRKFGFQSILYLLFAVVLVTRIFTFIFIVSTPDFVTEYIFRNETVLEIVYVFKSIIIKGSMHFNAVLFFFALFYLLIFWGLIFPARRNKVVNIASLIFVLVVAFISAILMGIDIVVDFVLLFAYPQYYQMVSEIFWFVTSNVFLMLLYTLDGLLLLIIGFWVFYIVHRIKTVVTVKRKAEMRVFVITLVCFLCTICKIILVCLNMGFRYSLLALHLEGNTALLVSLLFNVLIYISIILYYIGTELTPILIVALALTKGGKLRREPTVKKQFGSSFSSRTSSRNESILKDDALENVEVTDSIEIKKSFSELEEPLFSVATPTRFEGDTPGGAPLKIEDDLY